MLAAAVTKAVEPAWLAAALVGVTALGVIANAVSSIIGDLVQLRRLKALERARTEREIAQHQEVMSAIQRAKGSEDDGSTTAGR